MDFVWRRGREDRLYIYRGSQVGKSVGSWNQGFDLMDIFQRLWYKEQGRS
jgi:hypothetical protein